MDYETSCNPEEMEVDPSDSFLSNLHNSGTKIVNVPTTCATILNTTPEVNDISFPYSKEYFNYQQVPAPNFAIGSLFKKNTGLTEVKTGFNFYTPDMHLKYNSGLHPDSFRNKVDHILKEQQLQINNFVGPCSTNQQIFSLYTCQDSINEHNYPDCKNYTYLNPFKLNKKKVSWCSNVEIWDTNKIPSQERKLMPLTNPC